MKSKVGHVSNQMPRSALRFGAFEVAPESGELRKHGIRIKLQDQPFKLLLALLEKPGEVVSRDELRERIWGKDTFLDFDHGLSAAVNRLREALGDSAEKPRYVETMARRGYRFIAPVEGAPAARTAPGGGFDRKLVWAAVALLAAVTAGIGLWLDPNGSGLPAPRLVRLTALTGIESTPAFSPDGRQVAFVWSGEGKGNIDVYVKMVGSVTPLRLTSDPADDTHPAWSPDGSQIAFLSTRGQTGIYLVSPLGGPERKLIDLTAVDRPSWSADGRFLAVARSFREPLAPGDGAVLLVPVEGGGQPRPMLVPPPGTYYRHPAFSPDGRRLAVASCRGPVLWPQCQLQTVSLNRELLPQGTPRTAVSRRSGASLGCRTAPLWS